MSTDTLCSPCHLTVGEPREGTVLHTQLSPGFYSSSHNRGEGKFLKILPAGKMLADVYVAAIMKIPIRSLIIQPWA